MALVIVYMQFGFLFVLMIGIAWARRYISRYVVMAMVLILGRFIFRSLVLAIDNDRDGSLYIFLGEWWLIITLNQLAIFVFLGEIVAGAKCWRLRKIMQRKRKRELAKQNNFN